MVGASNGTEGTVPTMALIPVLVAAFIPVTILDWVDLLHLAFWKSGWIPRVQLKQVLAREYISKWNVLEIFVPLVMTELGYLIRKANLNVWTESLYRHFCFLIVTFSRTSHRDATPPLLETRLVSFQIRPFQRSNSAICLSVIFLSSCLAKYHQYGSIITAKQPGGTIVLLSIIGFEARVVPDLHSCHCSNDKEILVDGDRVRHMPEPKPED